MYAYCRVYVHKSLVRREDEKAGMRENSAKIRELNEKRTIRNYMKWEGARA